MSQLQDEPVREPISFDTSITLAGRAADPHRLHPCDDDKRLAVAVALTGVVIKQSLLEMASGAVLYRKVIDYSTAAGSTMSQPARLQDSTL